MRTVKHAFIVLLTIVTVFAHAQVRTNFNNERTISSQGQFMKNYRAQPDFEIPAKDINALLNAEERSKAQSNEVKPLRLAEPVTVDLDIAKGMNWIKEGDTSFGKYTIHLRGALSASINFDNFYLPSGTEMFIYNQNGKMITGPITGNENNANRVWGSWVLQGPLLNIEIKTPTATLNELLLHSNNIAYGYKNVYSKVAGFGASGPCQINVLCPLGNGWEAERNSVALVLNDVGSDWCSGAMVMNTCNTNRPFFLTADHCYSTNPAQNVANWRFTFQAWSATCTPNQNSDGITYNGSTLRANWSSSDFCLVELNNTPPANSNVNYAGWTRSQVAAASGTGIHHPSGDVMKISRDNNTLNLGTFPGKPNNFHWRSDWSSQTNGAGQTVTPVTEGGSSGSPLFDQNHRIVGQLSGGPSVCSGTSLWDFYGRFDLSWTGGGTSTTRLSDWLDPFNTNALTTNTTGIQYLWSPNFSISGQDILYALQQTAYSIRPCLPPGTNIVWSGTNNVNIINGQGTSQVTISICNGETATLTATLSGAVNQVLNKNITVNAGDFSITQYLDHVDVGLYNPYAQCFDWQIGSSLTSQIGNGNINCSAFNTLSVYPLTADPGYLTVRASNGNCHSIWRGSEIHIWQPVIDGSASYLNPVRGEPLYACLVSTPPDIQENGDVQYSWYIDDYLVGVTDEPCINSYDWTCGYSSRFYVVVSRGNVGVTSSPVDFWGMCTGGTSANYLSVSPNPATSVINVSLGQNKSVLNTPDSVTVNANATSKQSLLSNSAGLTNMYLYDINTNQLVKKWTYRENSSITYRLNVAGVKRGIYVLRMERDNIAFVTKVILE